MGPVLSAYDPCSLLQEAEAQGGESCAKRDSAQSRVSEKENGRLLAGAAVGYELDGVETLGYDATGHWVVRGQEEKVLQRMTAMLRAATDGGTTRVILRLVDLTSAAAMARSVDECVPKEANKAQCSHWHRESPHPFCPCPIAG